jgi:hypothetical protein
VENGAIAAELLLSEFNRHRLARLDLAAVLEEGAGGHWFRRAQWLSRAGLLARLAGKRLRAMEHVASFCFLSAALCFRFAWVRAGHSSAQDDEAVARNARQRTDSPPNLNVIIVTPEPR